MENENEKTIATITFLTLVSTNVSAALILPVKVLKPAKIENILVEKIEYRNLGPTLNKGNPTSSGAGGIIAAATIGGAVGGFVSNAAYEAASEETKARTGHTIGGHFRNGIHGAANRSNNSRGVSFGGAIGGFISGIFGGR